MPAVAPRIVTARSRASRSRKAAWILSSSTFVLPETGALIGDVVLFLRGEEHRQGEIGYVFHPDYGGWGYATEAARALLGLGFEHYGLHRIVGRLDARNTASARVLERLGMRREAHFVQNPATPASRGTAGRSTCCGS
jgi:RimJ/RimL family protein N-acetyltransferase